MKRITLAFLSVFLISPCLANIHIQSGAVEAVIKQKISGADAQVAALSEYNAQIKNAGGTNAGIPASGIWQVCKAAGWDITKPDGESKCQDFVNALMKYATWKFRALCGEDNIFVKNGFGRCIDDVFSNKVLGGTKVNQLIANGLAKEYARIKFADNNLACSKKIRQTTLPPDDYIQCISMDKNMAYEFRFDSVTETLDAVINEGTESGVCKIFGLKYSPSGYSNAATLGNGQTVGSYESWNAACETTDASICSKVNESMSRFGRSAKIGTTGSKSNKHSACVISGGSVSASNLRTAFGIDNYAFKNSGVQLNANVATQTQVCDWVKKTVKSPQITSCKCNDGFTQIYDFSGAITEIDDVLTCNINNKPVDFVFDDLSESNKKVAKGGAQGMDCMAAGGTYAGEQCINLDEQQCKLLASANLKNCPTCKRVKYQNGVCQLPSGADAENVQKNTNIALIIGGAVVGVTVTVATGGAGAVVVLTGIETVGAAIELGAQLKIDAIADEFLVQSNNCKSASCAKNLIKNNFQHLADSQNDFSAPEISAIDSEMARLANLIPENDDFWADIALNSLSMSDNQSGIFENWTPEQVWRAVGITLQMASIVTSVGKWIGTKAKTAVTKLSKSSKVLVDKTDNVVKAVAQTSDDVLLSPKRTQLKQKISEGKPIRLSSGEEITIPKGQLASAEYDVYGNVIVTAKSKYKQVNQLDDVFNKYIHKGLSADIDTDGKFIYHITETTNSDFVEAVLRDNGFRYIRNGDTFLIKEDDIAKIPEVVFDEIKFADKMDFAKAARTDEDIYLAGADLVESFKNDIFFEDLYKVATKKKNKILNIVANDRNLSYIARNFNTASMADKQKLAQGIVDRLEISGLKVHVLGVYSAAGEQTGKDIYIGLNYVENTNLNGFIKTLAHEHNHAIDALSQADGALAHLPTDLIDYQVYSIDGFQNVLGLSQTKSKDLYINALTEQASYYIGDFVGDNFESDLIRMLR